MKDYELVCVIRPDLSKEVYEEIKEKMSSVISSNGGELNPGMYGRKKASLLTASGLIVRIKPNTMRLFILLLNIPFRKIRQNL